MLNTLTSATFKYRGHYVTARRMVDTLNGKFFCWQGFIDNLDNRSVAHKSLKKFEEQFRQLADQIEERFQQAVAKMEKRTDVTTFGDES